MDVNLPAILAISVIALLSPGPAVLVITGTALSRGRAQALFVAFGVMTISLCWSATAAFGLAAIMLAHAWVFEAVRLAGGVYLLFLAWRAARSAFRDHSPVAAEARPMTLRAAYLRGMAVHLTNPKPVLFFGSLFALAVPPGAPPATLLLVMGTVAIPSLVIFCGYAFAFSIPRMVAFYGAARRWIELGFAMAFGIVGVRVLASRSPL